MHLPVDTFYGLRKCIPPTQITDTTYQEILHALKFSRYSTKSIHIYSENGTIVVIRQQGLASIQYTVTTINYLALTNLMKYKTCKHVIFITFISLNQFFI